jgi:hypothetical protein
MAGRLACRNTPRLPFVSSIATAYVLETGKSQKPLKDPATQLRHKEKEKKLSGSRHDKKDSADQDSHLHLEPNEKQRPARCRQVLLCLDPRLV